MTELAELRNRHQGRTIYIVGSGPTLDKYDLRFLKDEITICVNWAFRHCTDPTFQITKHHETAVECLTSTTSTTCVVSEKNSSHTSVAEELQQNDRVVLFAHPPSNKSGPIKWSTSDAEKPELLVSWSTITSAMHLAAYLGASTVVLVGYDGGVFPQQRNVSGYKRRTAPDLFHKHRYWAFVDQTLQARNLLESAYDTRYIAMTPFLGLDLEGTAFIGRFGSVNLSRRQIRQALFDKGVLRLFTTFVKPTHRLQILLDRIRLKR